ncbi:SDR family oxidoreductase [Aquirhabdus parva]|uniref:Short-chain dehydrogenase n=1 Tax=Aquirhabdus parva TaxID=2283318 RepID=A0A345PAG6_9GAMM|nr:SDR family oxidoreductase [Aquirhabdus parva]AXI04275.1 short-chain dehydrogenase [Aquirhabdus parva]
MNATLSPQNILIIGATSGIAEAVARRYASIGANLFLVARNSKKLAIISSDLIARGATNVQLFVLNAHEYDLLPQMVEQAWAAFGIINVALIAYGTLPDQTRAETDLDYAITEFRTNAESVIACLTILANRFETQGYGVISVIGSVASDRGRGSNYVYGSAKSAIESFTSGLRSRLYKKGVHVLLIKPGFVATAMTANLNLPEKLTASPESVAINIQNAISHRKNVVYTPSFWAFIMLIIKLIPNIIFKRLSL